MDVRTISYHLGEIFDSGELKENATIRKIGIVQTEGEREVNRPQMMQVVAGTSGYTQAPVPVTTGRKMLPPHHLPKVFQSFINHLIMIFRVLLFALTI